jgi:Cyclic nucleotide-binding domain
MSMFSSTFGRFASIRRIPLKIVIITALASWALQVYAIVEGQPLYVILILTLLPWIPLVVFESIWKYQHYQWIAIFAVVAGLQVGHMAEHTVQVLQLGFGNGTLACPPPGTPGEGLTGLARVLNMPNEAGQPTGVYGPPACGVLGFLDFEPVHLIWDTLVWIGALVLLTRFPGNPFLWIAALFASLHEIEHLFLGYIYLVDTARVYQHMVVQWDVVLRDGVTTGIPQGLQSENVDFYHAGGISGVMGRNGLVETLLFGGNSNFLIRPYLHFGYNLLVVIPTVLAFLWQSRKAYNQYLAEALPTLTEEELIRTSPKLERQTYKPGSVVVRQGDPADKFYILTKGQAEVLRENDGQEVLVTRLGPGQYFGEIGLLHGGKRIATVRAADDLEVLALDRETFGSLMGDSELSRREVDRLVRQRVGQLQAFQGSG